MGKRKSRPTHIYREERDHVDGSVVTRMTYDEEMFRMWEHHARNVAIYYRWVKEIRFSVGTVTWDDVDASG